MRNGLITGGSRGIGAAIVRAFTDAGDRVAFFYHTNHTAAATIAAKTGAIAIPCDVADPKAVREGLALARTALGGDPTVLVNNAGVAHFGLSRDVSDTDWRNVLDTNLSGAFYLAREVQGAMIREKQGRIILIGSMWGKVGASCEVAYSAAKAGLRGLTMSLAKELGPSGIRVNAVAPGVINTDMNKNLSPEDMDALREETPLMRIGEPTEIAKAVLFLASDASSFITGDVLNASGGYIV